MFTFIIVSKDILYYKETLVVPWILEWQLFKINSTKNVSEDKRETKQKGCMPSWFEVSPGQIVHVTIYWKNPSQKRADKNKQKPKSDGCNSLKIAM
jgi:hypothetical protein